MAGEWEGAGFLGLGTSKLPTVARSMPKGPKALPIFKNARFRGGTPPRGMLLVTLD
jgi:hypothetical protein